MTEESKIRYSRLIAVDMIGKEGMERLMDAKVLIVGCGALGSMVAMQLAASGVGCLRIVDFDTIDLSNLQRQYFFKDSETGKKKVPVLAERIKELNPTIKVEIVEEMLQTTNAANIIKGCDIVVEATDNPSSMLIIDKICEEMSVPCVMAGVTGFSGQVLTCSPGGRRYQDIFPETAGTGILPCSIGGVVGAAASLAASVEASEVIKIICGIGSSLQDKLLIFDLHNLRFDIIET